MDSLTQLALGAALGGATAGRQVGRRALLWGAVCGTFPDLDMFIPLGDPVSDFTYHRSASHSLLVLTGLTPLFVWLILKLHPGTHPHRWRWAALVYLVLTTHVLLDCLTVYGTQIFWPLDTTPVAWSTIFIVDPLYSLPLLAGIVAALVAGRSRPWGHTANTAGLVLSTAYLAWTVGVKLHVEQVAHGALAQQGIEASDVLTTPAPFNSVLWRILAVNEAEYYEGYYSLLDESTAIALTAYPRSVEEIETLQEAWAVRRLQWFTRNFYAVEREDGDIIISDLRMGLEPDYVFRFVVGRAGNPHPRPVPPERAGTEPDWDRLPWLWQRIRGRTVTSGRQ